jgi:hypothetical protein
VAAQRESATEGQQKGLPIRWQLPFPVPVWNLCAIWTANFRACASGAEAGEPLPAHHGTSVATTEVSGIVARLLERKADIRRILTASAPVRTRRTETTILALISGGNRGLLSPEMRPAAIKRRFAGVTYCCTGSPLSAPAAIRPLD